jgi:DNA-binding beta-propeller fold protein YncE
MAKDHRVTASLFSKIAAIAVVSLCSSAWAQTLYAVSVRTYSDPSYKGIEGNLYRVDPATAVTTLVAPLRLDGRDSIGLDGLAIHPKSGEFFGTTAPTIGPIPHSLVRLDPEKGTVSLIGNLGVSGSDISFDAEGTLFMWLPATSQIARVDLKTGAVRAVGTPRPATAANGGLEVTSSGVALVAASGGKGTLDSIDLTTGAVVASVPLKGARYPELIAGLAKSPDGTLLGVNTNGGTPAFADLVEIDRRTGQVTTIGPLPNDTDAIAFGPVVEGERSWDLARWRSLLLAVATVSAIGIAIVVSVGKLRRR